MSTAALNFQPEFQTMTTQEAETLEIATEVAKETQWDSRSPAYPP